MKWTDKAPTELGWYWLRQGDQYTMKPVQIVTANYLGRPELWVKDDTEMRPLTTLVREGGQWSDAPVPEPEEA